MRVCECVCMVGLINILLKMLMYVYKLCKLKIFANTYWPRHNKYTQGKLNM